MWIRGWGRNLRNINTCFILNSKLIRPHPYTTHTHRLLHLFMVCYMSHWVLNKEQKGGSGGLLVAQGGFLPVHRKDVSSQKGLFPFITACIPWKVHPRKKILFLSFYLGRRGLLFDATRFTYCNTSQKKPFKFSLMFFRFPAFPLVLKAPGRCFAIISCTLLG